MPMILVLQILFSWYSAVCRVVRSLMCRGIKIHKLIVECSAQRLHYLRNTYTTDEASASSTCHIFESISAPHAPTVATCYVN